MIMFLYYTSFCIAAYLYDALGKLKNTKLKVKIIYWILALSAYIFISLISFEIKPPSPSQIIRNLVEAAVGKQITKN